MFYLVQNNVFENDSKKIIDVLDRLGLNYEVIEVRPFEEFLDFKTSRKDIFPFGSVKMARLAKNYDWQPGSQLNDNHNFLKYKDYYKENLLNYDSKIMKLKSAEFSAKEPFFARPIKDNKSFNGGVFNLDEWNICRDNLLTGGYSLDEEAANIEIQISSIKKIYKEIRFFIVNTEPVTASIYKIGGKYFTNGIVEKEAYDFVKKMAKTFQLNDAFTMDIALTENGYKIVECGCINCAGFYDADLQKLLINIEEGLSQK